MLVRGHEPKTLSLTLDVSRTSWKTFTHQKKGRKGGRERGRKEGKMEKRREGEEEKEGRGEGVVETTWFIWSSCLEKAMATRSSVLAWRIPGMGEPGGLLSMGSHRVGHD